MPYLSQHSSNIFAFSYKFFGWCHEVFIFKKMLHWQRETMPGSRNALNIYPCNLFFNMMSKSAHPEASFFHQIFFLQKTKIVQVVTCYDNFSWRKRVSKICEQLFLLLPFFCKVIVVISNVKIFRNSTRNIKTSLWFKALFTNMQIFSVRIWSR